MIYGFENGEYLGLKFFRLSYNHYIIGALLCHSNSIFSWDFVLKFSS